MRETKTGKEHERRPGQDLASLLQQTTAPTKKQGDNRRACDLSNAEQEEGTRTQESRQEGGDQDGRIEDAVGTYDKHRRAQQGRLLLRAHAGGASQNPARGPCVMKTCYRSVAPFPGVQKDDDERAMAIALLLRFLRNVFVRDSAIEGELWFNQCHRNEVAICCMIYLLELLGRYSDPNVVTCRANKVGNKLVCGNRRDVVKFVARRLPCTCLKELHCSVKGKVEKVGLCFGCQKQFPRSELFDCTGCRANLAHLQHVTTLLLWSFLHGTHPTRTFPPEIWTTYYESTRGPAPQLIQAHCAAAKQDVPRQGRVGVVPGRVQPAVRRVGEGRRDGAATGQ
ncbi:hypothetical protein THAOC_35871, partial [Thalassiosira oceanica]